MPFSTLEALKTQLRTIQHQLPEHVMLTLMVCTREEHTLHVHLTQRFYKRARKAKMWASKGMLTALKNASYGFDPSNARSRGGADGLFLLDRHFTPANTMMKLMFDGFLDKETQLIEDFAEHLDVPTSAFQAARLVSHHTRLLGLLVQLETYTHFILVDLDHTKRA